MPVTLRINTTNDALKTQREKIGKSVIGEFEENLVGLQVVCFLDNADWRTLKDFYGKANRGITIPFTRMDALVPRWGWWPIDLKKFVALDSNIIAPKFAFDRLIYLHGSTCEREASHVMTLAHELQHCIQYSSSREIWAANTLLMNLPRKVTGLNLVNWALPIEIDARLLLNE